MNEQFDLNKRYFDKPLLGKQAELDRQYCNTELYARWFQDDSGWSFSFLDKNIKAAQYFFAFCNMNYLMIGTLPYE